MRLPVSSARVPASLACLFVSAGACDGGAPSGPEGLRLVTAALAPCAANGNGDRKFPENADKLVLRLTGGGIPSDAPIVVAVGRGEGDGPGEVLVPDLPPGESVELEAVACQGDVPTWAGVTRGVVVTAGEETTADLFLTPVGAVACAGSPKVSAEARKLSEGHAFAASWANEEAAWIFGGFDSFDEKRLTATDGVEAYDRVESRFSGATSLAHARAMAIVRPISGERLLVVGGVRELDLVPTGAVPPFWPPPGSAPGDGVEVYRPDPDPEQATAEGAGIPLPALPALAATPEGRIVAVGGVRIEAAAGDAPEDAAAAEAWVVAEGEGEEVDAELVDLPKPRYGAAAIASDGEEVLVWGGNLDGAAGDVALLLHAGAATAVPLAGTPSQGVPLFATGRFLHRDGDGRLHFLVVGGTNLSKTGEKTTYSLGADTARIEHVVVDAGSATFEAHDLSGATDAAHAPADPPLPAAASDHLRRAFATVLDLGGGTMLVLGGFTSFISDPACPGEPGGAAPSECMPGSLVRLAPEPGAPEAPLRLGVAGPVLESAVATFGATAVLLGDGSWLVTGGLESFVSGDIDPTASLVRFEVPDPGLCEAPIPER